MNLTAFCLVVIAGYFTESLVAQSPSPTSAATPSLEQRVSDLEKRLQAIESIPGVAMALKMKGMAQSNAESVTTPTPQSDAPLELYSWQYRFKSGQYSFQNTHLFTYVLRNRSDKAIKLVEGSLIFTDLLEEKLVAIRLLPDVKYPAGGTTSSSGAWDVNQFESGEGRMATLSHDDVKANLVIRKIVFADNSVWSGQEQQ